MSYFDKTLAEKVEQADEYFGINSSILHFDWIKYTLDERKAAVAQSEREINLYLGISLEQSYYDTDFPLSEFSNFRPDFAIFIQAYFILDNTVRTRTSGTGPKAIESEQYQEQERVNGVGVAPQAVRYLQMNQTQLERGS